MAATNDTHAEKKIALFLEVEVLGFGTEGKK